MTSCVHCLRTVLHIGHDTITCFLKVAGSYSVTSTAKSVIHQKPQCDCFGWRLSQDSVCSV